MKFHRLTKLKVFVLSIVLMIFNQSLLAENSSTPSKDRCKTLQSQQINKQSNLRAAIQTMACKGNLPQNSLKSLSKDITGSNVNLKGGFAGSELNMITDGTEGTFPAITQAGSVVFGNGSTIVTVYNDTTDAPDSFSGMTVSTNDGITFDKLVPNPFGAVFATDSGSPAVAYDVSAGKWLVLAITTDCGAQSIGLMSSATPETSASWVAEACVHAGVADDHPMLWVDNNSNSAYYGRRYISYNDFDDFGSLKVLWTDTGVSPWNQVTVAQASQVITFVRNVNISGMIDGTDGFVYIFGMDEAGGAGASPSNWVFRSEDGGASWTNIQYGSSFPAIGAGLCGGSDYFYMVPPNWRHMGWGQGVVGPGGVLHYVYARARPNDIGDVYYARSTSNGANWTTTSLNTDLDNGGDVVQWQPSVSVTAQGLLMATWYDRRNTTDGLSYQYYGRLSLDNGLTWQADKPVSDVIVPQATQFDPAKDFCFAGESNINATLGNDALVTWTDGRNTQPDGDLVEQAQMDVYFKRIPLCPIISISADALPNGELASFYTETLSGSGGTGPYIFALSGLLPDGLALDDVSGEITGTPTVADNFFFSVIATDAFGCQGTEDFGVVVNPDPLAVTCPAITLSPATLLDGSQGAEETQGVTASGSTTAYTYAVTEGVLPFGVTLDSLTGELSGVPQESSEARTPDFFSFDITATDANQCTGTQTYTQIVTCPMITLLPETQLPDAAAGFPYLQNVTANGGTAPYKFRPQSAHLNGLYYGEGGAIFGVTEGPGTKNTTIEAVDTNGCTGSRGFRVDSKRCPPGELFCDDKIDISGDPASFFNVDICGTSEAQWFESGSCGSSGDIGHATDAHARWGLTVPDGLGGFTEDCNSYGTTASQNALESLAFDVTNCNSGEVRVNFNYLMSFEEDTTFDRARIEVIADGAAAEVVADNGAGGPTCGGLASPGLGNLKLWSGWQHLEIVHPATTTFQVNFIAETDNGMSNAGEGFFIDNVVLQCVCPIDFIMMPDVLPNATLDSAYEVVITTEGGQPDITFDTPPSSDPIPPGLSLDSATGIISGIPTSPGIFPFRLEATDDNACQIFKNFNLLVSPANCPALDFDPLSLDDGIEGTFYATTLVVATAVEPNTFVISEGVLPPGLSLNTTTGVVSGTPTVPGIYPFTISVVDSTFCSGSIDYNINISPIGCPAITITPDALANPIVDVAYSAILSGNDGEAPYQFSITGGSLPAVLSLDSVTGEISGIASGPGSFAFEVTAQDVNGCFGAQGLSMSIEPIDVIFKNGFEPIIDLIFEDGFE